MSMTVSVHVFHKDISKAKIQRRHDLRLLGESTPKYIDRSKSADNSVIIESLKEGELKKICLERRALVTHKRAMKSSSAVVSTGIITFSKEAQSVIKSLPVAEQNSLYLKTAEKIASELNTTLTGLTVHRDESAPHAHFQMPSVALNGKPVCKILNKSDFGRRLQDIAGEVYKELGINRGTPKKTRIAAGEDYLKYIHRSVKELHESLESDIDNKQKQSIELDKAIAMQNAKIAKNESYYAKTLKKMANIGFESNKQEERLKDYKNRITKQKLELAELENQKTQLKADILELQSKSSELQKREEAVKKREEVVEKKDELYKKFSAEFTAEREIMDKTADQILREAGINKKVKTPDVLKSFTEGGISAVKSQFNKISMTR